MDRVACVGLHVRKAQGFPVFIQCPAALDLFAFGAVHRDQRVECLRADQWLGEFERQRELALDLFGTRRCQRETLRFLGFGRRFCGEGFLALNFRHAWWLAVAGDDDQRDSDKHDGTNVPQAGHGRTQFHCGLPGR